MDALIRPMTPEDIPAAVALWQATPGVRLRADDEPGPLAAFLARNPGCSFVASAAGELVGVGLAGHDGRRAAIYHLAVASDRRRGGVGRALVGACLAAVRAAGVGRCHVFVLADNAAAVAFWQRLGAEDRAGDVRVFTFPAPPGTGGS